MAIDKKGKVKERCRFIVPTHSSADLTSYPSRPYILPPQTLHLTPRSLGLFTLDVFSTPRVAYSPYCLIGAWALFNHICYPALSSTIFFTSSVLRCYSPISQQSHIEIQVPDQSLNSQPPAWESRHIHKTTRPIKLTRHKHLGACGCIFICEI